MCIRDSIVTVQVTYPGASPEIMESQVAQPVEDVLSGIEGLDFVTSISRAENTQITAQFRLCLLYTSQVHNCVRCQGSDCGKAF